MQFEMVGRINIGKETEKFKPFSVTKYADSGWMKKRLMFNAICGDNRHTLTVSDGTFEDENKGFVYTYSKAYTDEDGKKVKGESLKIPFKDRFTSPKIQEVAEYKKFVFDLEKPGRRYKLEKALEKIKEGKTITDEELLEMEVGSETEIKEAYEKSKKKRHEFICQWDFIDFIKKVIDSGKYADKKFFIKGNGEYQYSDKNQTVYENYVPNRIYLAAEDTEEHSTATLNLIYGKDSLDDMSVEEKGKYYINGYVMEYDSNRKTNIPCPTTVVIPLAPQDADAKEQKRVEAIKRKFMVDDDTWKELGVVVKMLNGAQKTEITDDMLTDEQKEDLEFGLITLEDIRAELGGNVYGERIRELQFDKIARGFSKGRNDTVYTDDDMVIRPIEQEELPEGVDNLFEEDDDDEL